MHIPGFTNYAIDLVIKFGGSLLKNLDQCRASLHAITDLKDKAHRILIVPGGGPTDKTIETINRLQPMTLQTCHHACALAQDQTGLMLTDPALSRDLCPCVTFGDVENALDTGQVAVMLPSRIIFDLNPIEKTWDVTSDAVAAWFAWVVDASRFVVLTDVDGVYAPTHLGVADHLIHEIHAEELASLGQTAVDVPMSRFLAAKGFDGWVLNGWEPERLRGLMQGNTPLGTLIKGRYR